jgi:phosphoribosyl 1,2-cyclic phosphate phosphodiesterase
MKITFLGTSAANAYPEAFCNCENCQKARLLGGPSLRKRSAILVNDDLLIDLGPDIMAVAQFLNCPLTSVRYCLQTHPHADHLDVSHLLSRSPEYGVINAPVLNFYASAETLQHAAETFERDLADYPLLSPETERRLKVKFHEIAPLRPLPVGRYRVVAFPANHAPGLGAMLYSIEENSQSLFYGTDTATLFERTWQALHHFDMKFDVVILDHTYGPGEHGDDHLSAFQVSEYAKRVRIEGILKPEGRVYATHIAHDSNPPHPELVVYARQYGYDVAYDGLMVDV